VLQQVLKDWPLIQIGGTAGLPPEMYRFTYNLKGLYVSPTGEILERNVHVLEVNLTLGYPRRAPQCRMLTPVFIRTLTIRPSASATSGRPRKGWTT